MLFVWYMACVSSPFAEFKDEEKLDTVIDLSFPKKFRDAKRTEYQGCSFPTHIREALVKMRSYDLPHRLRNRVFCEQFYANLEHISKVKVADESGKVDFAQAKDYANMISSVTKTMRELSAMLENTDGFGVAEEDPSMKLQKGDALRAFHLNRSTT